jgi:hypothetical protein
VEELISTLDVEERARTKDNGKGVETSTANVVQKRNFRKFNKKKNQNKLKGKCALGPFLSILVIECQHKWSCVNLCQMMDKVEINIKVCF